MAYSQIASPDLLLARGGIRVRLDETYIKVEGEWMYLSIEGRPLAGRYEGYLATDITVHIRFAQHKHLQR